MNYVYEHYLISLLLWNGWPFQYKGMYVSPWKQFWWRGSPWV